MNPAVHKLAMILAVVAVGLGYLTSLAALAYASIAHDGANTDRMVWFGLGSLLVLACLLLGAPVVLALLRGVGLPVPVPAANGSGGPPPTADGGAGQAGGA